MSTESNQRKTEKCKRGKIDVLIKVLKSKAHQYLGRGWGRGEKNIQTNYFLIRRPIPTTTPMGKRVKMGVLSPISILNWIVTPKTYACLN